MGLSVAVHSRKRPLEQDEKPVSISTSVSVPMNEHVYATVSKCEVIEETVLSLM